MTSHKITTILGKELEPGDKFRMTRHPFSVEYTADYYTKIGICGHGIKPNGDAAYTTVGHYDTVYKIEEVDDAGTT